MRVVTERRKLSSIAYGLLASQALFAALAVDLFSHLADGPRTRLSCPTTPASRRLVCGR